MAGACRRVGGGCERVGAACERVGGGCERVGDACERVGWSDTMRLDLGQTNKIICSISAVYNMLHFCS